MTHITLSKENQAEVNKIWEAINKHDEIKASGVNLISKIKLLEWGNQSVNPGKVERLRKAFWLMFESLDKEDGNGSD